MAELSMCATVSHECNTVDTPNFVSSYQLQSVVNDSDLLAGRDFAPLTHRISQPLEKTIYL